jgi:hypothetical protein
MEVRAHHETILQTVETLAILSPAIAVVGRQTVAAVKAAIKALREGTL